MAPMQLPVMPPVKPMLAKLVPTIPTGELSYEPKWDGFRSIVFRDGDEVEIGSRNERPLTRYFPEIVDAVKALGDDGTPFQTTFRFLPSRWAASMHWYSPPASASTPHRCAPPSAVIPPGWGQN